MRTFYLVPKLLFGNALPRNSVSFPLLPEPDPPPSQSAKQSFAKARSQRGLWERGRGGRQLEPTVSDLVNEANGLTPPEVKLMWDSAPPRMPVGRSILQRNE
jgi:hypothetical protein